MKTVQTKFVYKRPNKKVKPQIESLLNQKRLDFSKKSLIERGWRMEQKCHGWGLYSLKRMEGIDTSFQYKTCKIEFNCNRHILK